MKNIFKTSLVLLLSATMLAGCGASTSGSSAASNKSSSVSSNAGMTKAGDYMSATDTSPKYTLVKTEKINKSATFNAVNYNFTNVSLIHAHATDSNQVSADSTKFGQNYGKDYYLFEADYSIKNNNDSPVNFNGASVIDPDGNQLDATTGSYDSIGGYAVQNGAKKTGYIQAVATKSDKNKLSDFKIVSGQTFKGDDLLYEKQQISLN